MPTLIVVMKDLHKSIRKPKEPSDMHEMFTDRARQLIQLANKEAIALGHATVTPEHLLVAMTKQPDGVAVRVINNLGIDVNSIRQAVAIFLPPAKCYFHETSVLPKNEATKLVIECAIDEARNAKHNYVGTEHILLGIMRAGNNQAAHVLLDYGITLAKVRTEITKILMQASAPAAERKPCSVYIAMDVNGEYVVARSQENAQAIATGLLTGPVRFVHLAMNMAPPAIQTIKKDIPDDVAELSIADVELRR